MHCRNGTSLRQIPVHILMSLASNYPCNNSAFKHLVQKLTSEMLFCMLTCFRSGRKAILYQGDTDTRKPPVCCCVDRVRKPAASI